MRCMHAKSAACATSLAQVEANRQMYRKIEKN